MAGAPDLTLWGVGTSRTVRPHWAMFELGLPYKVKPIGPRTGETKTEEYTAEDFRFTTKGNDLYAIELAWPSGNEAIIHSVAGDALKGKQIQSVALLGTTAALTYKLQPDGLHIQLPSKPPENYAYAFRIALDSQPK